MDSLFTLLALALIAVFILPIILTWNSNNKINRLLDEIGSLKKYIGDINKNLEELKQKPLPPSTISVQSEPATANPIETNEVISESTVQEPIIQPTPEPEFVPVPIPEVFVPESIESEPVIEEQLSGEIVFEAVKEKFIPVSTFTPKKKTDFEQFIGEKLISLVGIAILVLGIFFTVKWAIGRNMITDAGKILIGLAAGTLLIGVAHKLSKNYRAFSSILAGGGIAVLYFSIYQAYQSYHLLPQTAAFGAMVLITLFAVVLSLIYNKMELAVIALVGGFATPFFVSNGAGNYQVLFSYLLILNVGMFVLSIFKKWNLLNIIGYAFTVMIFSLWLLNSYDISKSQQYGGLLFASLFYIVFFATLIIYNVRNKTKFGVIEIMMLLSNSFLYLAAGLFLLGSIRDGYFQGSFVIALAIFNFVFAYWFYRNRQVDKNLIFLLVALVLTFTSLVGPVQLDGNYITLFWACETVILYWLGIRANIHLVRNASVLVVGLTLVSLGLDWNQNYYAVQINKLPIILNKAFITGLVVIAAFYVKLFWVKRDTESSLFWGAVATPFYTRVLEIIWMLMVYLVGYQELGYQSYHISHLPAFRGVCLWSYHLIFLFVLFWYACRYRTLREQKGLAIVGSFSLLLYPIANEEIKSLRLDYLEDFAGLFQFNVHYLIPISGFSLLVLLIGFVSRQFTRESRIYKLSAWYFTFITCFILSAEVIHIWVLAALAPGFPWWEAISKAIKVAWPILWSLLSLSLMWVGMRHRIRQLRIISLTLFTITIIKLFAYDISNVSQGGKIAAFIILGIILLIVSFMYQKIKGLFTDEKSSDEKFEL